MKTFVKGLAQEMAEDHKTSFSREAREAITYMVSDIAGYSSDEDDKKFLEDFLHHSSDSYVYEWMDTFPADFESAMKFISENIGGSVLEVEDALQMYSVSAEKTSPRQLMDLANAYITQELVLMLNQVRDAVEEKLEEIEERELEEEEEEL